MIRIGELAKRAGISPELVRAWERRYDLLRPSRTEGGFRLYEEADLARIGRMRELIDEGLSAREAARIARGGQQTTAQAPRTMPVELAQELERALSALDEAGAHDAIDRLLGAVTVETFLSDVVLPALRDIGERWATKRTTLEHEHFASALIRGRLLGLARGWDRGVGRRVALACAPGELHDIGVIAFGIVLARAGFRVLYLGQDTPVDSLADAATHTRASAAVVSSIESARFADNLAALRKLSRTMPLAIGGAGANADIAQKVHARLLPPDLVAAARDLASS